MDNTQDFQPDWASAPGDTITDVLRERGLSAREFARRIGQSPQRVEDLLCGRASITLGIARTLTEVLGSSVEFWMSRDFQYREDVAKLQEKEQQWLDELPLTEMIKFGWIKPAPMPADELETCLEFFGVESICAWHDKYSEVQAMVSFRTSPTFASDPAAVAAWLRQGELAAAEIDCKPWDALRFREALQQVRPLTRKKSPDLFLPALRRYCAECGVAVIVIRAPTGCRASGATRFISPDKGLLQLSFRYLTDDHFWFTFFHEAGHLLLHDKDRLFLERSDDSPSSDDSAMREEREANQFAEEILIPTTFRQQLLKLPAHGRTVIRFARRVGVSPGIVVGQLQHIGRIDYSWLNSLKRRFSWDD